MGKCRAIRQKMSFMPKNQIGDEFHYLLECPFFLNERKKYIDPYYFSRPNILKYSHFLNITNESKLIRLSKFMKIIMKSFVNEFVFMLNFMPNRRTALGWH